MSKYDDEFSKKLAANTGIPENRVRETMSFLIHQLATIRKLEV